MAPRLDRSLLERSLVLARELARRNPWRPLPGPQTDAYASTADIIGYGGAAGGGKSDLACGKAITKHRKVMILRRVGTELTAIEDRLEELLGTRDGYSGQKKIWKLKRPKDGLPLQIEMGSLPNLGDEKGYAGRPHDLLIFDEAANFLEQQVRFLLAWLRTTVPGQICQALLTFNPPTSAEGRWIIEFFAPWLDPKHPNPAHPGELRWFATVAGKDLEVDDNRPFVIDPDTDELVYDFDPADYRGPRSTMIVRPMSRTFIPSRVSDNPHLVGTGYMAQLQALPEPLRSQMLNGDFQAGMEDDVWQVIPTAWVDAAQARWKPLDVKPPMDSLGCDVARGGKDNTVIARRHGWWFDELLAYPGTTTPNGPLVAGLCVSAVRDEAPIHIDVIGVGSSPYDFLHLTHQVIGVVASEGTNERDKSGRMGFANTRSWEWWTMRELLDPDANNGIALPNDPRLKADLCAPTWKPVGTRITVESREEIIKRIGRSPDYASAVLLASHETVKRRQIPGKQHRPPPDYDPMAASMRSSSVSDYDPHRNIR